MPSRLQRPWVHFLALGALLYGLDRAVERAAPGGARAEPVVITAGEVSALRERWRQEHGRPPAPTEEAALIDERVVEELLLREALSRGLHERDLVLTRHLAEKMAFLEDGEETDVGSLLAEAAELGLHRSDPIVRRRLVQEVKLLAGGEAGALRPTEEEVRDYYRRHAERFVEPARLRLSHAFLSRDRHGESLDAGARTLLEELRRAGAPTEGEALPGDAFLLGQHLPPRTPSQLEQTFGPGFAEAVAGLEPRRWHGPVASAYGAHLVWIHELRSERPAELEAVRTQVLEGLRLELRERRLAELVEALRRRHPVRVERPE